MRQKKTVSLQRLYFTYCLVLSVTLLFICVSIFYWYTTRSLKQNLALSARSDAIAVGRSIDSLVAEGNASLIELQTDATLFREAKNIRKEEQNYFASHVDVNSLFSTKLRSKVLSYDIPGSITYISNYDDNIRIVSPEGERKYYPKEMVHGHVELNTLRDSIRYISYLAPHEDFFESGKTVYSVARAMRDTYYRYGIVIIDFDISTATSFLSEHSTTEAASLVILNENRITYSEDSEINKTELEEAALNLSGQDGWFSFGNRIYGYKCSETTGWIYVLAFETAPYLHSRKQVLIVCSILFVLISIVMSAFLYLLTRRLTASLRMLSERLQVLEPEQNIEWADIPAANSEVYTLIYVIKDFLAHIYEQNQMLTEERQRTMRAHYEALESQMNPHFLYNSLSVIGLAGLDSGNMEVFKMCGDLANLLRYSLSYTGKLVRIEQEIENIQSYLYIMKMRYEDRLVCTWELDMSLNDQEVPKLILQPIVENCFQHGFSGPEAEREAVWRITVKSYCVNHYWYVSIENNGRPFSQDILANIHKRVDAFKAHSYAEDGVQKERFGLENTILRLSIHYEGREFFHAESKEGITSVTIGGPCT